MSKSKRFKNELIASHAEADIEVQIAEILSKLKGKKCEWLLVTQQLIFPCEAHIHRTRESLVGDVGSALTCGCAIVAVYHQDRRLLEAEISALRAEGFSELGPISKARAEGKF